MAAYRYDSWGKVMRVGGNQTIAGLNPFRYRGYYYDEESGLYYLNSRYYDPETGRFVNADDYVSTGQGLTGFNMFCYCGNNPVNRIDVSGHLWKEILEFLQAAAAEIESAIGALVPVYIGGGAATAVDGPFPFVDIVVGVVLGAATIGAVGYGCAKAINEFDIVEDTVKAVAKVVAKAVSITKKPNPESNVYYHVTSKANALIIMGMGFITPGEFGYVYAWQLCPSKEAARLCGGSFVGKGSVIIRFESNDPFIDDTTVNTAARKYLPVRSFLYGPVSARNAVIVRVN